MHHRPKCKFCSNLLSCPPSLTFPVAPPINNPQATVYLFPQYGSNERPTAPTGRGRRAIRHRERESVLVVLAVTGSVGVGGDSQCKQFTERTHNSAVVVVVVVVEKRRGDEDEEGMLQSTSLRSSSLPSFPPSNGRGFQSVLYQPAPPR